MRPVSTKRRLPLLATLSLALCVSSAAAATRGPVGDALRSVLAGVPATVTPSGRLLDRSLPLVDPARFDGAPGAVVGDAATFRQLAHQLDAATAAPTGLLAVIDAAARTRRESGVVPLAWLDLSAHRLRADAVATGARVADGEHVRVARAADAVEPLRVVAAAALAPATWRGGDVRFALDPAALWTDAGEPRRVELDAGDGRGFRDVVPGAIARVRYASAGAKTLALRVTTAEGSVREARFAFPVNALAAPTPDDTLFVTAAQPHLGVFGTGRAYVRYAPGHASLVNPVVLIEGFDIDNSMDWDPLYALLNQQGLADTLRAHGFDAVVLDFTDSTHPVQENAYVTAELLRRVDAEMPPGATMAVVGASMGGLCSRFALAWLESTGQPVRAREWIAFDAPFAGADIPLGLQYWVQFFAGQSADADTFLTQLNSPAARQMLIYHYTDPPGTTGAPDPLRAGLLADFAALGWPQLPRRAAVANGSRLRATQGFQPGDPVIQWSYSNLLVTILGNVWAVPNATSRTIFDGRIRIFLVGDTRRTVTVSGTQPWDGAPGGYRASFTQLDTVAAPYGDIVALHPNHCFVPVISSLALTNTTDPFYDVAGDPALVSHSPFDALFAPDANEEHVFVSPASAAWIVGEIERGLVDAPVAGLARPALQPAAPNPFVASTRLAFALPEPGAVDLRVFDVAGREVASLAHGAWPAGAHEARWDGRDGSGAPAAGTGAARRRRRGSTSRGSWRAASRARSAWCARGDGARGGAGRRAAPRLRRQLPADSRRACARNSRVAVSASRALLTCCV